MLTIEIVNDGTGNVEIGNYRYRVTVNGAVIDEGAIKGHERSHGWQELAQMVANDSLARMLKRLIVAMGEK